MKGSTSPSAKSGHSNRYYQNKRLAERETENPAAQAIFWLNAAIAAHDAMTYSGSRPLDLRSPCGTGKPNEPTTWAQRFSECCLEAAHAMETARTES